MEINNKEFYKRKNKTGKTCPIDLQVKMDKMGCVNCSVHIERTTWEKLGRDLEDLTKHLGIKEEEGEIIVTRLNLLDLED